MKSFESDLSSSRLTGHCRSVGMLKSPQRVKLPVGGNGEVFVPERLVRRKLVSMGLESVWDCGDVGKLSEGDAEASARRVGFPASVDLDRLA